MSLNMSEPTDWYTDKGRVSHFVGLDESAGEVSNYSMDAAYNWVNVQLARRQIDASDAETKTALLTDPNITMAQTWYACFLITNTVKANQEPARMLADGRITSQALGQGNVSIGYSPADPSEHYDELTTPDFHMLSQRSMRDFFANMVDGFGQPLRSIMVIANSFDKYDYNPDFANRLYTRRRYWR